uniref:Uncharacterized protein n=1 Tax=Myoviridae sp. ctPuP5 TaxID=2823543 RepID=A0A8S5LA80_9CAUD|nr:MAG TPA: hypothetical protein [Myoviridae sp. ctPuP5]
MNMWVRFLPTLFKRYKKIRVSKHLPLFIFFSCLNIRNLKCSIEV